MKARFWSMALACTKCDWEITPDTEVPLRNILFPLKKCPMCQNTIYLNHMECPTCGTPYAQRDIKRTLTQLFKGINICRHCGCEADRWGVVVKTMR